MKRKCKINNSELDQEDGVNVSLPKKLRRTSDAPLNLKRKHKGTTVDAESKRKKSKTLSSVKGSPFSLESNNASHLARVGREEKNICNKVRLKCTINIKKILDRYDLSKCNIYSSSNKLAKNFEELAFVSCLRERQQYEHRIKQLCYGLKNNGEFLLKKYSVNLDVIVCLEDTHYGEGTASEHLIKEHAERTEKQNALIHDSRPIIDEEHIQDIKDFKHMTCNKCGSDDIDWKTAQTRSADEGMTQFFTCRQCKTKWKK